MEIYDAVHEFDVPCAAQPAFEAFTESTGQWWSAAATAAPEAFSHVSFEPRAGGEVTEVGRDGTATHRGTISEWVPGKRLVFTFSKAADASTPSTIAVDFVHTGDDAARVRIEHRTGDADRFDDWDGLITPYAELLGVYTS